MGKRLLCNSQILLKRATDRRPHTNPPS